MSTDETEIFSALIGEVYDAALDPGVWSAALAKIAAYVGGDAAVLAIREISNRTARATYFFNSSEAVTDAYNQTYIKLDPTYIGFNLAQIGDAISTDDVLPYEEFVETRFYKEFAVPQGWVDSVGLLVDRTQTSATVMCVIRGSQLGLADADAKRRARLVGPHLRRAVVIGRQLAHHKARADNLASALDGIGAAFFLVDGVGRLQHVNAAGVEALERGEPLHAVAGRLVARDADANRALALVVAAFTVLYYKNGVSDVYQPRPRPSQVCPALLPPVPVPGHPSYPSGHATEAHLIEFVLNEVFALLNDSKRATAMKYDLAALATRIARNREIAGLHYPTDSSAGQKLATDIHTLLQTSICKVYRKAVTDAASEWAKQS